MNKFIIFASFFVVTSLHILLFLYYRNAPIITSLPNISNPTIQFRLTKITELEKPIEKPAIEEKKEIVKEIVKEIKKEEIQKPTEKIKAIKKETPKKIEKEKVQVKEIKKTIPTEQNTKETIKPSPKIDHQENMLIDKYASKLREEINKNKTYPTISKKLHEQGSVIVSFRVLKSGEFINIRLISSSSKERLDKAALNALYDTKEFEVFDKEINKEFLDFNLPLEFKLN
ncbi:MAG: TonB family protein [Aliarcobacter sp.]|jgi:protein TonB|nr:TonB family protein [Aliarcobacter sp.]